MSTGARRDSASGEPAPAPERPQRGRLRLWLLLGFGSALLAATLRAEQTPPPPPVEPPPLSAEDQAILEDFDLFSLLDLLLAFDLFADDPAEAD